MLFNPLSLFFFSVFYCLSFTLCHFASSGFCVFLLCLLLRVTVSGGELGSNGWIDLSGLVPEELVVELFTKSPLWHRAKQLSALSCKFEQDLMTNRRITGGLLRCRHVGGKRGMDHFSVFLSQPVFTSRDPCVFRSVCFLDEHVFCEWAKVFTVILVWQLKCSELELLIQVQAAN